MMHQTGIIKIAQFNGAIEIYSRPTPVAMITKWLFLNRKLAVVRLVTVRSDIDMCNSSTLRYSNVCDHGT